MNPNFNLDVVDAAQASTATEGDASLIFVDDFTYEFVGGGMAANGL